MVSTSLNMKKNNSYFITYTLIHCFTDGERISAVTTQSDEVELSAGQDNPIDVVLAGKEKATHQCRQVSVASLDRVLALHGKVEPMIDPQGFMAAARSTPALVCPAMSRYFLGLPTDAQEAAPSGITKAEISGHFPYRLANPEPGTAENLTRSTLLVKDYLSESYELIGIMVDPATPAGSVLKYLAEMSDGRLQPVALFSGTVTWLPAASTINIGQNSLHHGTVMEPLAMVLTTLLDTALVRQGFLAEDFNASPSRSLDWLANLLKSRAVVALETDHPFTEHTLATALHGRLSLPIHVVHPATVQDIALTFTTPRITCCVVLPMNAYNQIFDLERTVHELVNGNHAVLIGCGSLQGLPEPLRRIVETTITLPRIDAEIFTRLFSALYGVKPSGAINPTTNGTWIPYVQPWDLARIVRIQPDPKRAVVHLRHRIEDRLRRVAPLHGPSLKDLHGLGEARVRAEMLIADIRAATTGQISWSQVDRGMLLAGPPGTGKTALARAIAKDCGIRFVECSAARWQMAGHLNEHLAAMARDFAEARRYEPSILFIDEIDSIGSREQFSGSNASYSTQVVNALLAELQGFSGRGKVIVIAATNDVENVDPALRRAGRLDRVVKVSLPTIDALEKILAFYLEKHKATPGPESDIVLRPLAEAAFGRTGADISLIVRGALRRARMAHRQFCQDDLLAELYERPLDRDLDRPLAGEGIRRVALHEAGHALVRIKTGSTFGRISFVSIVPRPDGSLGFVALKPNTDAATLNREDFLSHLQVALAGRAAEEAFYGPESVGAGAGGSENSDLAKATNMAFEMICRLGLGAKPQLLWRSEPTAENWSEAEQLLAEAYEHARRLILTHRDLVERIAAVLIEKQEISGEELQRVVEKNT